MNIFSCWFSEILNEEIISGKVESQANALKIKGEIILESK